jgi:hypothetical protein
MVLGALTTSAKCAPFSRLPAGVGEDLGAKRTVVAKPTRGPERGVVGGCLGSVLHQHRVSVGGVMG